MSGLLQLIVHLLGLPPLDDRRGGTAPGHIAWSSRTDPARGYLHANGGLYPIEDYPTLADVTPWESWAQDDDPDDHFRTPPVGSRVVLLEDPDNGFNAGDVGGGDDQVITIPPHMHPLDAHVHGIEHVHAIDIPAIGAHTHSLPVSEFECAGPGGVGTVSFWAFAISAEPGISTGFAGGGGPVTGLVGGPLELDGTTAKPDTDELPEGETGESDPILDVAVPAGLPPYIVLRAEVKT